MKVLLTNFEDVCTGCRNSGVACGCVYAFVYYLMTR